MFTLDIDRFIFELNDGVLEHVGSSNKSATAKLYDVESVEVREFGDERVKLACEDDSGNEIEVALGPEMARQIASDIDSLEAESELFDD
jgi:hypothetical protein